MDTLVPRSGVAADKPFVFYHYEPSMPAAIVFVVLFALASLAHTYQMARVKTWFMIPFIVGGMFETVGYVGRILSAMESPGPYDKIPYIIQSLLLLLAPLFFAASIYMELGRIVQMVGGETKLFIRLNWLTKIFVIGDVVTFLIQASGSSMAASSKATMANASKYIVIGGLFLQILFFGLFVVVAGTFHFRIAMDPTMLALKRPWTKHMIGLYIVSGLILIRSTVRTVEFIQGFDGYIITREAFLYAFDAVMMFVAMVAMNIIHPGEVATYIREDRTRGQKLESRWSDVHYSAV